MAFEQRKPEYIKNTQQDDTIARNFEQDLLRNDCANAWELCRKNGYVIVRNGVDFVCADRIADIQLLHSYERKLDDLRMRRAYAEKMQQQADVALTM